MKKLKWKLMRPTLSRRVETRCELFADRDDLEPIYSSTVITEGRHDLIRLGVAAAVLVGAFAIALALDEKKNEKK